MEAIGRKCDTCDATGVPCKVSKRLSCFCTPQSNRKILDAQGDVLVVCREYNIGDKSGPITSQLGNDRSGGGSLINYPVRHSYRQGLSIWRERARCSPFAKLNSTHKRPVKVNLPQPALGEVYAGQFPLFLSLIIKHI